MTFSTLYESSTYVPYAVSVVSADPAYPHYAAYVQSDFRAAQDLLNYVGRIRSLSQLSLPIAVGPDDRLLTLVTCHGNEAHERLVLAMREIRPGEDAESILRLIRDGVTKNTI